MHEPSQFDQRQFRRCLSSYPTGVTVITTQSSTGEKVGVTVNSFASVSLDPPLILWSLASNAASRATFESNPHFVVNVLADDQSAISNQFAKAGTDKWAGVDFAWSPENCPTISGAVAYLHCKIEEIKEAGDHLIFLARVQAIDTHESREPLMCCRGAYHSVSTVVTA